MNSSLPYLLPALALAALSTCASAATTVSNSAAEFLAQLSPGAYTESFNGLPPQPPVGFASGGFSFTITSTGDMYASGDFIGTNLPGEALVITFTSGNVSAVGANFFASDIFDAFQSATISLSLSDGTIATFTPPSVSDSYRGFVSSSPITSLTISGPGQSLYAGLDNLTVGTAAAVVPEPASMTLTGVALAGLAAVRRRARLSRSSEA